MKNIHVLPTENESRLRYNSFNKVYELCEFPRYHTDIKSTHHIYITSNEEIKEDYVIAYGVVIKVMIFDKETLYFVNGTKAKREDCKKIILTTDQDLIDDGVQAIDDEFLEWFVKNPNCEEVETEFFAKFHNNLYKIIIPKEEPKQETLEEAFEKWADQQSQKGVGYDKIDVLQFGAKWQTERMYSEEEVLKILLAKNVDLGIIGKTSEVKEWFEQFKNK